MRPAVILSVLLALAGFGCSGDARIPTAPNLAIAPAAGPETHAAGAVILNQHTHTYGFNATTGNAGVDGQFWLHGLDANGQFSTASGRVACVGVFGTEVRIGGVIERGEPVVDTQADHMVWIVEDNGGRGDRATFMHAVRDVDVALHCAGGTNPPLVELEAGNVTVTRN